MWLIKKGQPSYIFRMKHSLFGPQGTNAASPAAMERQVNQGQRARMHLFQQADHEQWIRVGESFLQPARKRALSQDLNASASKLGMSRGKRKKERMNVVRITHHNRQRPRVQERIPERVFSHQLMPEINKCSISICEGRGENPWILSLWHIHVLWKTYTYLLRSKQVYWGLLEAQS